MASILVVEDEQDLGRAIQMSLADEGHAVHWVASAEDASEWIATRQVDLALLDIRLPRRDGLELLDEITSSHPDTSVVMMTAHGDVQTAVRAMKSGAADFLLKPIDLDAVSLVAGKNLRRSRIFRNWEHECKRRSDEFGLHRIVGECAELQKAKAIVRRISRITPASPHMTPNILITGETGTGKDLIARAVHYEGCRKAGPFIQVNSAALPESLAESELFGHVKGAFTDARTDKRGLFQQADQGTLFLDEVCSLPATIQAKLLTAIEQGRIRPVGASEERTIDVHLIAAMNRDPQRLIAEHRLRSDLYHRLRVVEIHLPPLRDRGDDIDLIADRLIREHCQRLQVGEKNLSPAARRAMRLYDWPGIFRELSHCLETAALLSDKTIEEQFIPVRRNIRPLGERKPDEDGGTSIQVDFSRGPVPLEQVEKELIVRSLVAASYNVSKAADLLDISRDTLRYRMDKYGIRGKRVGAVT